MTSTTTTTTTTTTAFSSATTTTAAFSFQIYIVFLFNERFYFILNFYLIYLQ